MAGETKLIREQALSEGKPLKVIDRIVQGRVEKVIHRLLAAPCFDFATWDVFFGLSLSSVSRWPFVSYGKGCYACHVTLRSGFYSAAFEFGLRFLSKESLDV